MSDAAITVKGITVTSEDVLWLNGLAQRNGVKLEITDFICVPTQDLSVEAMMEELGTFYVVDMRNDP